MQHIFPSSKMPPLKLKDLDVHPFFKRNLYRNWTPETFAADPTALDITEFTTGLQKIVKSCLFPICEYGRKMKSKLDGEAGIKALEAAKSTLELRFAQMENSKKVLQHQKCVEGTILTKLLQDERARQQSPDTYSRSSTPIGENGLSATASTYAQMQRTRAPSQPSIFHHSDYDLQQAGSPLASTFTTAKSTASTSTASSSAASTSAVRQTEIVSSTTAVSRVSLKGSSKQKRKISEPLPDFSEKQEISASKKARRMERHQKMDRSRFWRLRSGRTVEEVLFKASLDSSAPVKIRSFTICFTCPMTKKLFTQEEWQEIKERDRFELPAIAPSTILYLVKVKRAMTANTPVSDVPLPEEDRESCKLVRSTCMAWEDLYRKNPSPFAINDLSEAYWGRKSWPLLLDFLGDQDSIFMIDGEKTGIDSSIRRKYGRSWEPEFQNNRTALGRKLDLIARDVTFKIDWLIIERMKTWDKQSTKFLKESRFDLFRETHTIMVHRLQDTKNEAFENGARFFGIYTGDRGFHAIELRPAGGGSYVTLFHEYRTYNLPASLGDMKAQVQGLAHLLQIRRCMIDTITLYHTTPKQGAGREESGGDSEDDVNWIFSGGPPDLDATISLASSPISP